MPEYSGAGYRAHNLYKRLIGKYPEISLTILCGSETENVNAEYIYESFTVKRISCKPYFELKNGLLRKWQVLRNFQKEHSETCRFLNSLSKKPDLIHIFGQNYVTASTIDFGIRNSIPLLIELVTDLVSPFQFVPFPEKLWIRTVAEKDYKFVCISEKLREMCLKNGIKNEDIWYRPNPVDERRFHPVSHERKCEIRKNFCKFSADDRVISYIAKFRPSKNQAFLIEVLKYLPKNYKLFMKGPLVDSGSFAKRDIKYFESLKEKISKSELESRVEIQQGFCKEVEKYYQMSDVYAFPSEQEGLGTPVLEAIACGIPVMANRIPGVTDLWIKEGESGFLSGLDPQKFAEKIVKVMEIKKETLEKEAERIINTAGTEIIDGEYLKIMKAVF